MMIRVLGRQRLGLMNVGRGMVRRMTHVPTNEAVILNRGQSRWRRVEASGRLNSRRVLVVENVRLRVDVRGMQPRVLCHDGIAAVVRLAVVVKYGVCRRGRA